AASPGAAAPGVGQGLRGEGSAAGCSEGGKSPRTSPPRSNRAPAVRANPIVSETGNRSSRASNCKRTRLELGGGVRVRSTAVTSWQIARGDTGRETSPRDTENGVRKRRARTGGTAGTGGHRAPGPGAGARTPADAGRPRRPRRQREYGGA